MLANLVHFEESSSQNGLFCFNVPPYCVLRMTYHPNNLFVVFKNELRLLFARKQYGFRSKNSSSYLFNPTYKELTLYQIGFLTGRSINSGLRALTTHTIHISLLINAQWVICQRLIYLSPMQLR